MMEKVENNKQLAPKCLAADGVVWSFMIEKPNLPGDIWMSDYSLSRNYTF